MSKTTGRFEDVDPDAAIGGYEPKYVDVSHGHLEDIKTRYYDVGSGQPLVLVHGNNWSGSSSANTWTETFEYLADHYRVLAVDRIGCGMTDNPDNPEDFRYESDINHIIGFLDALDLETTHIAGWSRGGGLVTRVAVEIPDRIDSLIICNSQTVGPAAGDDAHIRDVMFKQDELGLEKTDPEYMEYFYYQYSHQKEYITDTRLDICAYLETTEKARETARIMDEEGYLEPWTESLEEHMKETHSRIKDGVLDMPVLYVFGRDDPTVPPVMALATYDMIGQHNGKVRMKTINRCGHMIFMEHPRELASTFVEFLDIYHGEGADEPHEFF
ncbi:alpha/beta fold hydrolase [Haloarcula marina]|uniref:alpha/beta fold hydrolase n=1 Tax=Haloarcula marina TaxID=2961574 RepID=UPI0020B67FF7|nr:alpha/beta hydrolase [Halomicroarcula marina]